MPAPTLAFTPQASHGGPAPGFGPAPSYGFGNGMGGMGNFMSMNQVNPGPYAAEGAQPWQGPWMNMDEMTGGAPLDLYNQGYPGQSFSGMGGAAGVVTGYPGQYPGGLAGAAGVVTGYPGQYPGGLAGGGNGGMRGKHIMLFLAGAALMYFAAKKRWI